MSGFLGGLVGKAVGALGNGAGDQIGGSIGNMLKGEGLQMLLSQARDAGLEDKVRSWIGNGENLPISTDEIRSLLTNQQVQQIVEKTGIPAAAIMPALAQFLPAAVDNATQSDASKPASTASQG